MLAKLVMVGLRFSALRITHADAMLDSPLSPSTTIDEMAPEAGA